MAEEMTLHEHHSEVMHKLCDIDHDTDALIKMEAEESMNGAYDSGLLAGLLNRQGLDAADVMALMNNNRRDGSWGDDGLMFLFLVLLLGGGNGLGWGNRGLDGGVAGVDRTVVNTSNYEMLMGAIRGNEQQMQTLAASLNCDRTLRSGQADRTLSGFDRAGHLQLLLQTRLQDRRDEVRDLQTDV